MLQQWELTAALTSAMPDLDPQLNDSSNNNSSDIESQPNSSAHSPSRRNGVLIGIIAIALLVALIPIGSMVLFWVALSVEEELRVVSSPSDGGASGDRYQLHVNYTGAWIYGPHGIILRVRQGNKTLAKYSTKLANDGTNLSDDNAQVRWDDETMAHICLNGEEQEPAGIRLTLEPKQGWLGGTEAIFEDYPNSCEFFQNLP